MKILVTGGAGFIGAELVKELLKLNHNVVILDNLSTGKLELLPADVELVRGDIRNPEDCKLAMQDCDIVYHLAAQVDVKTSTKDPKYDYDVNYVGTKNIVDACRFHDVQKLVYYSSAAVYGTPAELPLTEDSPKLPTSHYGLHKLMGEVACNKFPRTLILRSFNVYGDTPLSHSAINLFTSWHKKGEPLLVSDLKFTRDYLHIRDAIRALLLGLKPEAAGLYLLGTGKEVSVGQLVEEVAKLAGKEPELTFMDPEIIACEIGRSVCDASRANRELGWIPEISVEDGVRRCWDNL